MKCIYKKHELNKINSDNTAFNRDSSAAHEEIIDDEHCRLLGIINAANIGTWELNVQTGETTVNERWCEIIGYTINDLTPLTIKTWSLLLHPEDLARMNDSLDKYLTGHSSFFDIEYRCSIWM
jgi:PAS domain-containing protein